MIDILFEQNIIQNNALASEVLWIATLEAYETRNRTEGLAFPLVFLILPLAFHKRTAISLCTKTKPGSIYKALAENREIPVGLQSRMQSLFDRTLKSLSICISTGLIDIDYADHYQLLPARKSIPVQHVSDDVKIVTGAAKRIGQTLGELTIAQISDYLEVVF